MNLKNLTLTVFLLFTINFILRAQQTLNVYVGEIYEGDKLVSKGDEVGNKVTIDEVNSKITQTSKDGYKNQIFKIVQKVPTDKNNVTVYECEGRNNNGIYTIFISIDSFYQTIDYQAAKDISNKTGRYMRQYYK